MGRSYLLSLGYSLKSAFSAPSREPAINVVGLVYIAAFGLDEGESIGALLEQGPPTPALAHLDIDQQGFRLAARGRLRQPLRSRRRPRQGQGHVRGAAAAVRVRPLRRDERPGLEVAADLVHG
jgi:hypothetical protein